MTRREGECLIWTGALVKGYGMFSDAGRVAVKAHRWSWTRANGPIPDGLMILHTCDVPACVEPSHLYAGTASDNYRDMRERGRWVRSPGRPEGNPKISAADAAAIRESVEDSRVVAARYGITRATVYDIRSGRSWR